MKTCPQGQVFLLCIDEENFEDISKKAGKHCVYRLFNQCNMKNADG
ncbi:hypothetical protein NEISUBOT_05308 [Neisseria subflava NJ9703]|uniref:Uncharacterized protein n=1 Tax=Neisseria subflava NJ9703 TaxID=546268 RepID=A0A9W5MYJ9_NEISU|nr:hypothetical protein NEISUBOT_05308 [Neisseria subflava NJ9703]